MGRNFLQVKIAAVSVFFTCVVYGHKVVSLAKKKIAINLHLIEYLNHRYWNVYI